jgi:hypothetical protein
MKKMTVQQKKSLLIASMKTPEGKEVLKDTLNGTMSQDLSKRLCDAIDNGTENVVGRIVKAIVNSFGKGYSQEVKEQKFLKAIGVAV